MNQTAFFKGAKKAFAFFVGDLVHFDTMVGTSPRAFSAGYLMKLSLGWNTNLTEETCKSHSPQYTGNSVVSFS